MHHYHHSRLARVFHWSIFAIVSFAVGVNLWTARNLPFDVAEGAQAQTTVPPVIFYLDVESGPPGVFLTLNGRGFSTQDTIKVGSAVAQPFSGQYINYTPETVSSKVTVVVPELPNGTYPVTVTTGGGTSNALNFTVRIGRVFYVAKNGSDSAAGSASQPFLTLDYAVRQMQAGDFVYVREGTYKENPNQGGPSLVVGASSSWSYKVNVTGELSKPLTIQGYPGETALFTMDDRRKGTFSIDGADYVNINGLTFAHVDAGAVAVWKGSNNVRIVNNEIYDSAYVSFGTGAIWVWTDTDSVHMIGNSLHDIGEIDSNIMHSMYIQGDNMLVAYNKIYDDNGSADGRHARSGIQVYGRAEPVSGAVFHNNLIYGIRKDGILLAGQVGDALIYNNIIRDNWLSGIAIGGTDRQWEAKIFNNTFVNNGSKGNYGYDQSHVWVNSDSPVAIKNNIFYSTVNNYTVQTSDSGPFDVDYNLYYTSQGTPRVSTGANSKVADPLFASTVANDFRLQQNSPAINAGAAISQVTTDYLGIPRPQGAGYDLGAYEYVSGSVVTPSPQLQICSDNTAYNQCSTTKPKFCSNGTIIDKASQCGCPSGQVAQGDLCVTSAPNVTLTKSVDKSGALPGDTLTYTLTYRNTGTAGAQNITVTDTLPEGTSYVLNSATGGGTYSQSLNRIFWTVSSLVPGASGSVTFQIKVAGEATPSPDITPPTISITAPAAGTTVAGTVTVAAAASDNIGVSRVEFLVDGVVKTTDTSAPYSFSWDSVNGGAHACLGDHTHTLTAKAYDVAGNTSTSAAVVVNMNDPSYCAPTSSQACSDGTLSNQCSMTKPKYCSNGTLIDKASQCGCPAGQTVSGETCVTPPAPGTATPSSPAFAYVQSKKAALVKAISNAVAFPSSNKAGNLIIIAAHVKSTSITATVSDSVGNAYKTALGPVMNTGGSGVRSYIWYAENIVGGANTVTVNLSGTAYLDVSAHEYSGVALSNALDAVSSAVGNTSTPGSGTAAIRQANELIFGFLASDGDRKHTASANFTLRTGGDGAWSSTADRTVSSIGSYSADWTMSSASPWTALTATFVISNVSDSGPQTQACSNGTLYNQCSTTKPKYCSNGNLVDRASQCGCPAGQVASGENCVTPETLPPTTSSGQIRFAVIGDYGSGDSNEGAVATLVKSWNPDFVITTGDNNYPNGAASTIDQNIGQFYREFISPYTGSYGVGASQNKFYPSLGNHDWKTPNAQPYLDYFTLPGNERYYDFVKGPVHFFVLDSDLNEPDGIGSSSVQAQWLKTKLQSSTAPFQFVYFHHAPYSSGASNGSTVTLQWPFADWGAEAVLAGHDHIYERILRGGVAYFVNGLGGGSNYDIGAPIEGSQVRYRARHGAMLVDVSNSTASFQFINTLGEVIDTYSMGPRVVSPSAGAGKFSFAIVSDTHSGKGSFVKVAQTIMNDQDIKFVLMAGDNVNVGCNEAEYPPLVQAFDSYNPAHPTYPAPGSHEYYGVDVNPCSLNERKGYWVKYFGQNIQSFADKSGGDVLDYYSFDYKNLHVVNFWGGAIPYEPASTWMINDLAKSNADWKIAVQHYSPVSYWTVPGQIDDTSLRKMRIFEQGGLDIHVAGHSHVYERSVPLIQQTQDLNGVYYYMVGPSNEGLGGVHTLSQGHAGTNNINDYPYLKAFSGATNYAKVTIEGKTLTWEGRLWDGTVFDSFTLTKTLAATPGVVITALSNEITNTAALTYQDATGKEYPQVTSNIVSITIGESGATAPTSQTPSSQQPSNQLPIGYLDSADSTLARGWAWDPDAGTNPIRVDIYVDGKVHGSTTANLARNDLSSVSNIQGLHHGFTYAFNPVLTPGTHTIRAYAINTPSGNNPELSGSPKTVNVATPATPSTPSSPSSGGGGGGGGTPSSGSGSSSGSPSTGGSGSPASQSASRPFVDGSLVKAKGDSKVYIIENGEKRWIPSPSVFRAKGYEWSNLREVDVTSLQSLPTGSVVAHSDTAPSSNAPSSNQPTEHVKQVLERERTLVKNVNTALTTRLKGTILLAVEQQGEAWYVSPVTGLRHYLADGPSAFALMRDTGLGITNKDLSQVPVGSPDQPSVKPKTVSAFCKRTEGNIYLQVESRGEAWYMHNCKRYYLKNGNLAYQIMRFLSLGITNENLRKIAVGEFE